MISKTLIIVQRDTDNMKEIISNNLDMESTKKKMPKRKSERKKIVPVTFLYTAKMQLLKRFRKMRKSTFHIILKI